VLTDGGAPVSLRVEYSADLGDLEPESSWNVAYNGSLMSSISLDMPVGLFKLRYQASNEYGQSVWYFIGAQRYVEPEPTTSSSTSTTDYWESAADTLSQSRAIVILAVCIM